MATTVFEPSGISLNAAKANKVVGATSGNVATLNSSGDLVDSGKTLGISVPSDAVFTDTTYSEFTGADASTAGTSGLVPAPSVGDDEKFLKGDGTWGTVASSGGTVTSVGTGVGLTGGPVTTSGTIKANLKQETSATYSSTTITNQSNRQYAVVPDKDGYLSVNVPWDTDGDSNVYQVNTTSDNDYRVLMSYNANDTSQTTYVRKSTNLKYNPSTKALTTGGTVNGYTLAECCSKSVSDIVDLIYPVGSIYMSVSSTSPATLFGGTWSQLEGRFLLGCNSSYTAGTTGGASSRSYTPSGSVGSHTLTTSEIPSHSHGLNSHTHTYSKADSSTGGPDTTNTGSTTLTTSQMPQHQHEMGAFSTDGIPGPGGYNTGWVSAGNKYTYNTGSSNSHSHSLNSHGHSISYTSTNSGTASGNTATSGGGGSHDHSFSGSAATINTMPPYLSVYMWKRTA